MAHLIFKFGGMFSEGFVAVNKHRVIAKAVLTLWFIADFALTLASYGNFLAVFLNKMDNAHKARIPFIVGDVFHI